MGAVGRYDALTQRMSQKSQSAIFDPETGQLTNVPVGTKIAPRASAGKEAVPVSAILSRMKILDEKRLSKSMTPDEESEYAGWSAEIRKRGGLPAAAGGPSGSAHKADGGGGFVDKLMGAFRKKPSAGLPGLD
jgi:hypothetical protein